MSALEGDRDFSPYNPRGKLFGYNWKLGNRLIKGSFAWLPGREQKKALDDRLFSSWPHMALRVYMRVTLTIPISML